MKAKITKTIIQEGQEVYKDTLYNFPSFKDAQKRLLSITNNCRFRIINDSKSGFTCDKGFSQLIFKVEKQ